MGLDGTGQVNGASVGAFVGNAPDGALDYRNGLFYASDWKSGGSPGESWIKSIALGDIGDIGKSFSTLSYTTPASGLMAGWQFDAGGDLIGVSWQNFGLYRINESTGAVTTLYGTIGGLPGNLAYLSGLDAVVPEPVTILSVFVGLSLVGQYLRRRAAGA